MADYTKRIIPIVVGAVVAGIILISVLVYVLMRERRSQGYEQLWLWSTSKPQETTLFYTPKLSKTILFYSRRWILHDDAFRML